MKDDDNTPAWGRITRWNTQDADHAAIDPDKPELGTQRRVHLQQWVEPRGESVFDRIAQMRPGCKAR